MAVISGTITGCTLLSGNVAGTGSRKSYLLSVGFPAYNGAADTATITGVGAAIAARVQNGKTNTVRAAVPLGPGLDTANQAVHVTGTAVQALTVSSDDLTGQLSNAAGTELTSSTACKGCQVLVVVDES